MSSFTVTPRTQVRRRANRGVYDRETVYSILDEALVCHVAFVVDGKPAIIPTTYGRAGDRLYIHGSATSRMLNEATRSEVCVEVTLLDALVLARSSFHHSMNYRSVVIYGEPRVVDGEEKNEALRVLVEHICPGRWDYARLPNEAELKATRVIALDLNEVSAKVRTGPPIDDDEDYALDVWAGLLPVRTTYGPAERDPQLREAVTIPAHVSGYKRPKR